MATRQSQADAFARSKGFSSYYEYRNSLAREQGYRNYAAQRRARATGVGLKGVDIARYGQTVPPRDITKPGGLIDFIPGTPTNAAQLTATLRASYTELDHEIGRVQGATSRKREHRDRLITMVQKQDKVAERYYGSDFQKNWISGARRANPNYQLTPDDAVRVRAMGDQGLADLKAAHRGVERDARRWERAKTANAAPIRGLTYSDGSRRTLREYAHASINGHAARAFNEGYLRTTGATRFEVSDGPGCGWSAHRDPEEANGKIVTLDQALSNPIAHPHCRRTFTSRPDLESKSAKELAGKIIKSVADNKVLAGAASVTAVSAAALALDGQLRARVATFAVKVAMAAKEQFLRTEELVRLWKMEHSRIGNLIDPETGLPVDITPKQVMDDVASYSEDWAAGKPVPAHVRYILSGQRVDQIGQVSGDEFGNFMTGYSDLLRSQLNAADLISLQNLERFAVDSFLDYVTPIGGKYTRFSMPKIGNRRGKRRGPRLTVDPTKLVRITSTHTVREIPSKLLKLPGGIERKLPPGEIKGFINHISLNRHGLFRAGFFSDPETGFWTPNFRLVPKGPIRIITKVNRGKTGKINSLSTDVHLITRTPLDFNVRFNTNLRALGLNSFGDIRRLTITDLKRLRMKDTQFISFSADFQAGRQALMKLGRFRADNFITQQLRITRKSLKAWEEASPLLTDKLEAFSNVLRTSGKLRLSGYSIFDFSRTYRISLDNARKLMGLSDKWIQENWDRLGLEISNLRANYRRKRLRVIVGGGEGGPPPGPRPGSPLAKALGPPKPEPELPPGVARLTRPPTKPPDSPPSLVAAYRRALPDVTPADDEVIAETLEIFQDLEPSLLDSFKDTTFLRANSLFELDTLDDMISQGLIPNDLVDDVVSAANMVSTRYPNSQALARILVDDTNIPGSVAEWEMTADGPIIRVNTGWAQGWGTKAHAKDYLRDVLGRWFQPDKGDPTAVIVHEMGHHITMQLTEKETAEAITRMGKAAGFPKRKATEDLWSWWQNNANTTTEHLSAYASENYFEGMAEAFAEYHTSHAPRPMARALGEYLDTKLGPDAPARPLVPGFNIPLGPVGARTRWRNVHDAVVVDINSVTPAQKVLDMVHKGADFIRRGEVPDDMGVRAEAKSSIVVRLGKRLHNREPDKVFLVDYKYQLTEEQIQEHLAKGGPIHLARDASNRLSEVQEHYDLFSEWIKNNEPAGQWLLSDRFDNTGFLTRDQAIRGYVDEFNEHLKGRHLTGEEDMYGVKFVRDDVVVVERMGGGDLHIFAYDNEARRIIAEHSADRLIENWSITSSGDNPLALAIQHAADELFDTRLGTRLPDARSVFKFGHTGGNFEALTDQNKAYYVGRAQETADQVETINKNYGENIKAVLQEMYLETQEELQRQGMDEVVLYRGFGWRKTPYPERPAWAKTEPGAEFLRDDVHLQPISSFSSVRDQAEDFWDKGEGSFIEGVVPAGRILGTARSGFGCLNEYEFVVIDGPGTWRVTNTTKYFEELRLEEIRTVLTVDDDVLLSWAAAKEEDLAPHIIWAARKRVVQKSLEEKWLETQTELAQAATDEEYKAIYREYVSLFRKSAKLISESADEMGLEGIDEWQDVIHGFNAVGQPKPEIHARLAAWPTFLGHEGPGSATLRWFGSVSYDTLLPPSGREMASRIKKRAIAWADEANAENGGSYFRPFDYPLGDDPEFKAWNNLYREFIMEEE